MAGQRLTAEQVLAMLPQRPPFRFVDEIIAVDETSATGRYTFRPDEPFYAGHFPGRPVTPGVILLESMCQVGVVALGIFLLALDQPIEEVSKTTAMFVEAECEFFRPVLPGETVTIRGERLVWRFNKIRSRIEMFAEDGALVARTVAAGLGVRHA